MENSLTKKLGQIRIFSKVLSKVSKIRNRGAKQKVLNALEKNEHFQKFIHDPAERQQFLAQASPYIKYKFYPKGTTIIDLKQAVSSMSIIVKGRALVYLVTETDDMKKENNHRSQIINIYMKYIQREQLEERFKKWLEKHELGTKALRKRMASLAEKEDDGSERESVLPDDDDFASIIEKVLKPKNPLLPPHLREWDIPFEDKLVLLSKFGCQGDLIKNGSILLKVKEELGDGDTFTESAIVKPFHADFIAIAAEDTHIVTFSRFDMKLLFSSDIANLKEKVDFLRKMFPEVSRQNIVEMTYFLEERVVFNSETVYKEGEESDAIYLIKSGEIEISTVKDTAISDEYFANDLLAGKLKNKFNDKLKIMVGKLPAGSIFGEEEIIKRLGKRKYTAKASQPMTFLYSIKKKIFYDIYENHFPEVVKILTDWMNLKYKWREQRISKEKKIASLRSEDTEAMIEKENIEKKLIKDEANLKQRRSILEKDPKTKLYYQEETHDVSENASLRTLTNPNEFNNFGPVPSLYFSVKQRKNPVISPRADANFAMKVARSLSKDIPQTKETLEMHKTKLFAENQLKLNKYKKPILIQRTKSKTVSSTSKKHNDPPVRTEIATPRILNFERVKDVQKADAQVTGPEPLQLGSFRKPSQLHTSQISPRFFIVKSYGASQNSLSSLDSEHVNRRNSAQAKKIESILPISLKTFVTRRGTAQPISLKDEHLEENKENKLDEFGLKLSIASYRGKNNGEFMVKSMVTGLDSKSVNPKPNVVSKPGSLAYLDGKNDDVSMNEQNQNKKISLSLKDLNFGKKILSPRTADTMRVSPRIGLHYLKMHARGISREKNEA